MENPILYTENLSVGYGADPVLRELCLQAEPGKILTLIGPNGAGKTTLLKTLMHELPPLAGAVWLDGRELEQMREREIARLSAAVLTERPEPELMRCFEVVAAGRYPHTGTLGLLSEADKAIVRESMELVGVFELRDRPFTQISDGQRQRLLLARALCQEPKLLLLDEPTSFLDLRHKLDFLSLLRQLARSRGIAVILSLHELDLAQKFSDRLLCLRDGKIDRSGSPEELFAGDYPERLYGVEQGTYDVRFGSVEPPALGGAPRIFVLGGGGSGIPVYRALHRKGIPFAAGVLPENDMDLPVAKALAARVFTDRAFEPVGENAVEAALTVLKSCQGLILCPERLGSQLAANRALLDYAGEHGLLLDRKGMELS